MANLFPQVVDKSTLTGVFQADQFLVVGVEGQKDVAGSAAIALPQHILAPADADTLFGPASSLGGLCKFLLARGLSSVWAVASASAGVPTLLQRQTAWATLEDNADVRIRLSDSVVQADLVALADSCENAELIQHKQFCFCALAAPAVKATTITAAGAIASKRAVLMSPGVKDVNGALLSGPYSAAYAAAEIAKNPDIADSLNLASIGATSGVETEATSGLPVYRLRTNGGVPINDFEELLAAGVSPYQVGRDGQAAFTHLRTTWTTDTTFDALMTLLIKDQVFIGLRDMLLDQKFLRSVNDANNRSLAAKLVDRWLAAHSDWVLPSKLSDGTMGYGVVATPSVDLRSFTISYVGQVQRGTNVINIAGSLTIPV